MPPLSRDALLWLAQMVHWGDDFIAPDDVRAAADAFAALEDDDALQARTEGLAWLRARLEETSP